MNREALVERMTQIGEIQHDIEKRTMSGVDSPVGVHCNFIEWHKLMLEYNSIYNLIKGMNNDN